MKKIYERPLAEVIELTVTDIITNSLDTTLGGGKAGVALEPGNYDENYNLSAGGRITLN